MSYMSDESPSVQRSFRLSRRTVELLDAAAADRQESRNALADRLLGEAIRLERHPLVRFHQGPAGRRQPLLTGTRLFVHQVVSTLRGSDNNLDEAAGYLGISRRQMAAAIDYYAEFTDEVNSDRDYAEKTEREERSRWERKQRALS